MNAKYNKIRYRCLQHKPGDISLGPLGKPRLLGSVIILVSPDSSRHPPLILSAGLEQSDPCILFGIHLWANCRHAPASPRTSSYTSTDPNPANLYTSSLDHRFATLCGFFSGLVPINRTPRHKLPSPSFLQTILKITFDSPGAPRTENRGWFFDAPAL
jgi:hypothetical protein